MTSIHYRCEVRPGPQYLLRKYRFFEGGLFELHQYVYVDSHCHEPNYSLYVRGQFKPYQPSWIIDGAYDVDYQPVYVTVMPYSLGVASSLQEKLNDTSCRCSKSLPGKPYEPYVVYHYVENAEPSETNASMYIPL